MFRFFDNFSEFAKARLNNNKNYCDKDEFRVSKIEYEILTTRFTRKAVRRRDIVRIDLKNNNRFRQRITTKKKNYKHANRIRRIPIVFFGSKFFIFL